VAKQHYFFSTTDKLSYAAVSRSVSTHSGAGLAK
jgi:hypothetical protein